MVDDNEGFYIPDCGHTQDCVDQYPGEIEMYCFHEDHGKGGMLVPIYQGMLP